MRRDAERISDIIDACAVVARYIESRTAADFVNDRMFQDAVVRQLTIVGEAATNLSAEFRVKHPEIPWPEISGFRNRIIHDYFGIDLDTAWKVATDDLPDLNARLAAISAAEAEEMS